MWSFATIGIWKCAPNERILSLPWQPEKWLILEWNPRETDRHQQPGMHKVFIDSCVDIDKCSTGQSRRSDLDDLRLLLGLVASDWPPPPIDRCKCGWIWHKSSYRVSHSPRLDLLHCLARRIITTRRSTTSSAAASSSFLILIADPSHL